MIRIVALAALAAAALAGPAAAFELRVPVAGKSPAELKADIRVAARMVCNKETRGETFRAQAMTACVADTLAATQPKAQLAAL